MKIFWCGKWNCFHFSKSFPMWHRACQDAFNRMQLARTMKRKMTVGIHSSKWTRSSMFLFARRKSTHEYGILRSRCNRKTPLVISRDSIIRPFFLAPFSPLSWSLSLDLKEFWVSYRTKKPYNILASYLFEKALVPSKSKFLPVFHALTVCDTTSFSAGHGIAKILTIDFLPFFFYWNEVFLLLKP